MAQDYMLSTRDNPYNPWNDFDMWYSYDIHAGYNTLGYLARIAIVNSDMNDEEYNMATNKAIDEIIMLNPTNLYVKVFPDTDTIAMSNQAHKEMKELEQETIT